MKALVVGATGETGRRIVQQLVAQNIGVRALVRDRAKAQEMLPASAELVVGDVLQPDTLRKAIADCTVVFCATGARPSLNPFEPYQVDFEGTKNLVDAAKAARVEHFILVSSLCASQFFHPLNLFWLILVWKQQAEQYLQRSGLTYTIVRPGGLKNTEDRPPIVMSSADTLFDGSISRTQVAQVCVEALAYATAHNKIVEIVARPDAAERPFSELFAGVAA
ncbi:NAD(P)H-binding protein [Altericista sp. CCNU0014]|uniref:NAD(P)H-binding protein n=1 Tax=Altericista sp. CCNU0014 TaxID=3082949 RepID=UPI00384B42F1